MNERFKLFGFSIAEKYFMEKYHSQKLEIIVDFLIIIYRTGSREKQNAGKIIQVSDYWEVTVHGDKRNS